VNQLSRIPAPVWIIILTLFAIVLTGPLIGTSPCDRVIQDCYSDAGAARPDTASQQQASAAPCADIPCEVNKRGALVPITILIAGFVFMNVWFRQHPQAVADADADADAGDNTSSGAETRRQHDGASGTATDTRKNSDPSTPAPVTASPPPPLLTSSVGASAPVNEDEERKFCHDVLRGSADPSKEKLTGSLCRLIAPTTADQWKGARLADLEMLVKSVAAAALFGPLTAKYRAGLRTDSNAVAQASPEMQELTKRALADHCLGTLQRDLQSVVASPESATALYRETVANTLSALNNEGALSSLANCGKPGLLRLSIFLA
jgi:hypothetical protein